MTLTFELIRDIIMVNTCTKYWVRRSNGLDVRELTDAHTHTHTDRQTGPILYPRPQTREGIRQVPPPWTRAMTMSAPIQGDGKWGGGGGTQLHKVGSTGVGQDQQKQGVPVSLNFHDQFHLVREVKKTHRYLKTTRKQEFLT